jgi:hypothetical protein
MGGRLDYIGGNICEGDRTIWEFEYIAKQQESPLNA